MHISEGVLRPEIIIPTSVAAVCLAGYFLWRLKSDEIVRTAAMSAVFFMGSFIHVPLGITSIHLMLSGLVGVFAGKNAFLAILIALIFQGLLFGFGGFSVLGLNALMIGLPAILGAVFARHLEHKINWFLAGFVPIFISAVILSVVLLLNGEGFEALAGVMLASNAVLMVIEGYISFFAIGFILKVKPELLNVK